MNLQSKNIDKLLELKTELEEQLAYFEDLDTREDHYVFNIKVYDWLDRDEILAPFLAGLSEEEGDALEEEFNDERVSNIQHHTFEWEVTSFKDDFLNGAGHTSRIWVQENEINPILIDEGLTQLQKTRRINRIKKQYAREWQELEWLNYFDSSACWQWGRSGGWLSVSRVGYIGKLMQCS